VTPVPGWPIRRDAAALHAIGAGLRRQHCRDSTRRPRATAIRHGHRAAKFGRVGLPASRRRSAG